MKRVSKIFHKTKTIFRKKLQPHHDFLCQNWKWYKWWHQQNYHRQIHYLAFFMGLAAATYFLMIDEIMSRVKINF